MTLYRSVLAILLSFCYLKGTAQITFELTKFPKNNQLIPRNPATNIGTYTIVGTITRPANITLLQTKVWRDTVLERTYTLNVPTNVEKFPFTIPIGIKAELKNYTLELIALKGEQEITLAKSENVVSGDVFIINGQSNCIGNTETIDHDKFMRSYTDQFGWNDINYTAPSRWGPRMAKEIIDKEHIPVAIFCEAEGGMRQTYYMRHDINTYIAGNYGILYNRLKNAEVEKNVRALLWWQGESDGWETPIDSFKNQFKRLYRQWKEDYNTPIFYFQIRFRACTHVNPSVFEAQRQLANEIPNIEILSSNPALSNDGCHFFYANGYDSLGNQAYRLLAARLYNRSFTNTRPPNIVEAFFSAPNEITLKMKNVTGNLRVIGNPWNDFKLEGCRAQITGGSTSEYRVKLTFSGDTTGLTGISYLSHIDAYSQNWIVNPLGVGMLLFYDMPIHERQLTDTTQLYTEGALFDISPTAVSDILNIRFLSNEKTSKRLDIVNTSGQIVLTKQIEALIENTAVNVSSLPNGLYFVRLSIDNQIDRRVKKFIHL
jgi:hypothetical protein